MLVAGPVREATLTLESHQPKHSDMVSSPETVDQIPTPALLVESSVFDSNLATMDDVLPGARLRPHVKAFKSTALAARLAADGHTTFCAATPREIEGLVAAGLGEDLLLANESLDVARLGALSDSARITVAVDSEATIDAAIAGGIRSVLIDVEVGLPRCGCAVDEAGQPTGDDGHWFHGRGRVSDSVDRERIRARTLRRIGGHGGLG